ncbi:MAG: hypothetical protein CME69_08070 [Halobacteriovorax sp.]|nr:hypothetical protein [Halobacteriovorax sp.]
MMKVSFLILTLFILTACNNKDQSRVEYIPILSPPEKTSHDTTSDGVVDGSGGNLEKTSYEEFQKIIREDLPILTDELLKRSIKYFSYNNQSINDLSARTNVPELHYDSYVDEDDYFIRNNELFVNPFNNISKEIQLFFTINKDQILNVSKKLIFIPKKESCLSDNHNPRESDTAISSDRKICFSYNSFKGFQDSELVKKLLVMTIHEIAHYLDKSELEAQELQYFFSSNYYGKNLILIGNDKFNSYFNYLRQTTNVMNDFLEFAEDGSYKTICKRKSDLAKLHDYIENDEAFSTFLPYSLYEDFAYFSYRLECPYVTEGPDQLTVSEAILLTQSMKKLFKEFNQRLRTIYELLFPTTIVQNNIDILKLPYVQMDRFKRIEFYLKHHYIPKEGDQFQTLNETLNFPKCFLKDKNGKLFHGKTIKLSGYEFFKDVRLYSLELSQKRFEFLILTHFKSHGNLISLEQYKDNKFTTSLITKKGFNSRLIPSKEDIMLWREEKIERHTFFMHPLLSKQSEIPFTPYLNSIKYIADKKKFNPYHTTLIEAPIKDKSFSIYCEYP